MRTRLQSNLSRRKRASVTLHTIKMLAILVICLITSVAKAQQPPQPCHITITSDFESQCLLPLEKDDIYNEEPEAIIACQENTVTYTATTNTGGVPVVQWTWNVVGATSWNDNGNGTITVTWSNNTSGQISVEITTAAGYSCTMTQNVKLIEKPTILVNTVPNYTEMGNGDKIIYVCKEGTVEFTELSSTTNSDIVGYSWESDNPTITSASANFRLDSVMDNCKVVHRVYNNCGCYDEEVYIVKVLEGERLKLGCYGTVCHNATVTYTAENPPCDQYSWYVEGGRIEGSQDQQTVTVKWTNPQNGYGILGLDGILCGEHACPSMLSVKIPIIEDTLTIKGQEVACVDEGVIYSIPLFGSTKYTWNIQPTGGATMYDVNGANQKTVVFTQPGTYNITVSYECDFLECGEFTSKPLTVTVKPKLEITGEERICESNSCELKTNPNVAAVWQVADIANNNHIIYTSPSTATFTYQFPHAGKYRVTADNPNYCRPAVFVITVVSAPPAPDANDFDINNPHTACLHSSILLKANPTNPDYTIVWQPTCDDASQPTASGNKVTVDYTNTVCDINAYNYDRVLGCLSATPYVHTVSEFQLAGHSLPTNITVCPGAVLNWSVPNQAGVLYEWQLQSTEQNCASVQGDVYSNSVELLINELVNYPAYFTVTLKREYCTDMTDYHTINITVTNDLQATLTMNVPSQVCQYDNVELSGSGCSNSYEWHIEDNIQHGNPVHYTFNHAGNISVTMKCNPYYSCPNSNYYVSQTAIVNVIAAPPVTTIGYSGGYVYVIPTTLSTADYDFVWGHTTINSNIVSAIPGQWNYTCTVIDHQTQCEKTVSANVEPCQNTLTMTTLTPYDYCTKEISFSVTNATDNITWSITGGDCHVVSTWGDNHENIKLRMKEAGYYTIKARMDGEPCKSGAMLFTINFVPDITFEKACNRIIIHNRSSYIDGTDMIGLRYNTTPMSFPANQGTAYVSVPTGVSTYDFYLTSFDGSPINPWCSLGSVTIGNTTGLQVDIKLENPTNPHYQTCDNRAIKLTASVPAPHSAVSTLWDFDDDSYSSHSNPIYHTFEANEPNYYTVRATVTDENGCSSDGTVHVWSHVNNLTPGVLTPDGDKVCEGTARKLSYTPSTSPATYRWSTGATTTAPTNYTYVNETGDYTVEVENPNYCLSQKMKNVPFKNKPTAVIVTASSIYCEGETIKFYGSPDPDTDSYNFDWEITDLSTGSVSYYTYATVSYTPTHAGSYSVSLYISNTEGCSDNATATITVNPTPAMPSIYFNGNECIDQGAVNLSGTTPSTPPSTINWSNGYTGPNANYFVAGEAQAWYYDINTGCKSEVAKKHIEPQPDFDAVLTGCYEKCKTFFEDHPTLPVWGLTSGREDLLWEWYKNNNFVVGNTLYYPSYYLTLPLTGFGEYYLYTRYHNGNCPMVSPTLTINPKELCDCKDLDVSYTYEWMMDDCKLIYYVIVEVCNNSQREACLEELMYHFEEEYINVVYTDFSPTVLPAGDCYKFKMEIVARQFVPSSVLSFTIFDACNNCTTDFSIDLMPEKIECEMEMNLDIIEINPELSSEVAGYFKFGFNVNPAHNVFDFWTEPPMVIDYSYDGGDVITGLNMIDMSLLTQLVAEDSKVCFYALTCSEEKLCLRKYCMSAKELYDLFIGAGIVHEMAGGKMGDVIGKMEEGRVVEPRLVPNPTTGQVKVIESGEKVVEVEVMDLNGRKMAKFSNTAEFDISNLMTGIYIVRVKTGEREHVSYHKLVKK